ncbi:hypothetical protein BJ508DRAFT_317111 [Ascobolus immersus RN42]|uniref:DDE Tnp4 domain-containing protein n=1 Tax=Ascobolus immersus RN42 TaxID=1160509 RepID=A0A3N4IKD4_ASCIM|nr:hypothetical protein BJ508DRAFT_317111 [Ascobolus immersus RN42]
MPQHSLQQIFAITPAVCSRYLDLGFRLILTRHTLLLSAIGFVDRCHFLVARFQDMDVENAYYNGWCSNHPTSNLFAFGANRSIFHVVYNVSGSWHDRTPVPFYIMGNTAFTTTRTNLAAKIRTPPKCDFLGYSANPAIAAAEIRFNEELLSTRQAAEWGMQCIQGCASCLKVRMPADNSEYRARLIELCILLHNLRVNRMGINQIRTVYEEI